MRTFPESPPSPCEQCGAVLPGYLLICPHCGAAAPLTNAQPQALDSPPVVAPEVSPPQRFAPLRFFKVSPARRRRTKSLPAGAPDWSLSLGAATVLIGFAVAFGTYITLTERDAMQDRSFTISNPAEPRPTAPDVSPNAAPTRIERLTQQLQQQIAELRSRSAGTEAAVAVVVDHAPAAGAEIAVTGRTSAVGTETAITGRAPAVGTETTIAGNTSGANAEDSITGSASGAGAEDSITGDVRGGNQRTGFSRGFGFRRASPGACEQCPADRCFMRQARRVRTHGP